ncbi:hypothetical protein Q1695_002793 [Nippostrongylus brasiliensis]|nr:hypothetical protein Q1695_002793 [Nippostrongylus brasiliensis]
MFRVLSPRIIAITTASLLNATAPDGIFRNLLDDFKVMLCDDASQLPRLILAAVIADSLRRGTSMAKPPADAEETTGSNDEERRTRTVDRCESQHHHCETDPPSDALEHSLPGVVE